MNKLELIYDFMNVPYLPPHSPTHLPVISRFWMVDLGYGCLAAKEGMIWAGANQV